MHKQVIIIGASLAGLSAAKKLKEQNIPFVLLEANIPVAETALDSESIEVGDYRKLDVKPISQKI